MNECVIAVNTDDLFHSAEYDGTWITAVKEVEVAATLHKFNMPPSKNRALEGEIDRSGFFTKQW